MSNTSEQTEGSGTVLALQSLMSHFNMVREKMSFKEFKMAAVMAIFDIL